MKYANPKHKEEFEFIAELMKDAHRGSVPEGIVDRMRKLYGEPLRSEVPMDLADIIKNASPDFGRSRYIGGWNPDEKGPKYYFRDVRQVVLAEFYPRKLGFDRIRQYWKEQRE